MSDSVFDCDSFLQEFFDTNHHVVRDVFLSSPPRSDLYQRRKIRSDQGLNSPSPAHSTESFWDPLDELKPARIKTEFMQYDEFVSIDQDLMIDTPSTGHMDAEESVLYMPDLSDLVDNDTVSYVYGIINQDGCPADLNNDNFTVINDMKFDEKSFPVKHEDTMVQLSTPSVNYTASEINISEDYSFSEIVLSQEEKISCNTCQGEEDIDQEETDQASECSESATVSDIEDSIHEEYKHSGHKASYLSKLRNHRLTQNRSSSSESESEDSSRPAMVARLPPKRTPLNFVGSGSTSSAYNSNQASVKPVSELVNAIPKPIITTVATRGASRRVATQSVKSSPSYTSARCGPVLCTSQSNARYNSVDQSETRLSKSRQSLVSLDMSKNAVQARINREKKKQYIAGLEQQVSNLEQDNKVMSESLAESQDKAKSLADEVEYLRSVLANQSALSTLIGSINGVRMGGVVKVENDRHSESAQNSKVGNSRRKRSYNSGDHDYTQSKRRRSKEAAGSNSSAYRAGVCVHVCDGELSVQMCRHCAKSSQ